MSFAYTEFKRMLAAGEVNWAAEDVEILLLLNTTSADTEEDVTTVAGFATLGEVTDGSYARKDLAAEALVVDNPNNRAEASGTSPIQFLNLSTGGVVQAALVCLRKGAGDANMKPAVFIDSGGFPFSATGVTLNININAEGLLQIT